MEQSDHNYLYETVRNKGHSEGTNSLAGAEILQDTTYSYLEQNEPKLYVATSFVSDNKLYHLCSDSSKTFIAELEKGSLVPVQTIAQKLSTFDWYYSYRNKIQKDNSQLLKFKANNQFGLIEVKGKEINILYLNFN